MSPTSSPSTVAPSASPAEDPTTLTVGGLPIDIYGLSSLLNSSPAPSPTSSSSPPRVREVAVLFLLHGRLSSSSHPLIGKFARTLLNPPSHASPAPKKDLLVVTFDQRNHGHRLVSPQRNLGWFEGGKKRAREREELGLREGELDNETHAVDMVGMQTGTSHDVSFLISFLPSVLAPYFSSTNSSFEITDWFVAGISLGGHATWLALAQDPRLTLGLPIIASPSSLSLLSHRASSLPPPYGPIPVPSSRFPASLVELLEKIDPDRQEMRVWRGKRILVLSGGEDRLVGWKEGGSREFVQRLREEGAVGEGGRLEVWVQPETGHACTPEMMHRARDFVWKYGLGLGVGASVPVLGEVEEGEEGKKRGEGGGKL